MPWSVPLECFDHYHETPARPLSSFLPDQLPPSQDTAPKPKEYPLGPDSERRDGVPQGVVTKQVWKSEIYPGTIREFYVYVPAQDDPNGTAKAAVMVFQDGHTYVPTRRGRFAFRSCWTISLQRGNCR